VGCGCQGGPIVLYIMGVLYMFVFLSIVCDEVRAPLLFSLLL
jgi:hypothetical protein